MSAIALLVSELSGPPLDWATAYAIGQEVFTDGGEVLRFGALALPWSPSTNWAQGGLLVETNQIALDWDGSDGEAFWWKASHQDIVQHQLGPTPLVAACRAIVAAKLGGEVEIPVELVPEDQRPKPTTHKPCCNWPKCGCVVMHGEDCIPF